TVRSLALGLSLPAVKTGRVADQGTRDYWVKSVGGAIIARELAAHARRPCPDDDLVAGLLRDLGEVLLRQALPAAWDDHVARHGPRLVDDPCGAEVESFGIGQWAKAPAFAAGPTGARVCSLNGTATATFSVSPYGTPTLRWRRGTTPLSDNLRIMGSTTATLSIAGITAADLGAYNCVASDACGQSTASADALLSACTADFDCSGIRDVSDIFSFLSAWFAGDPRSDINGVNGRDVADIFAFLSAWFGGCV
ncbi:MAG: HDOD domain-containing protein, partial [Phycisphaerales bacterium]|nr:HDOD domain-containing protein [Phycisphaerales bacterium]